MSYEKFAGVLPRERKRCSYRKYRARDNMYISITRNGSSTQLNLRRAMPLLSVFTVENLFESILKITPFWPGEARGYCRFTWQWISRVSCVSSGETLLLLIWSDLSIWFRDLSSHWQIWVFFNGNIEKRQLWVRPMGGWNSTLQAAWYVRHAHWARLCYVPWHVV